MGTDLACCEQSVERCSRHGGEFQGVRVSALQRCVCLSWQSWGQHVASWQFICLKALNPIRVPKRMQHTLITSEICLKHRRVHSDSLQLRFGLCGWRCSEYANIPTWFKGRVSGIRGYGLGRLEGNGSLESVDSKCDSQYIRYIEQVVYKIIPDFKGCVSTRLDPCITQGFDLLDNVGDPPETPTSPFCLVAVVFEFDLCVEFFGSRAFPASPQERARFYGA